MGLEQFLNETAKLGREALDDAAKFAYEQGRMKLHTSWEPTFLKDKTPKEIADNGFVNVALPFQLNGEWYPALKSPKLLRIYDKDYPHLILSFEDPHKKTTGDEVLRLEPKGKALQSLCPPGQPITWRLYMPGNTEIQLVGNGGKPVIKPQAEVTAGDVVDMFINRIDTFSQGKLKVSHQHLHQALSMITYKSEALRNRWEILDQRLKFQSYLMNEGHQIAAILRSNVVAPPSEFRKLVDEIEEGRVTGWGSFLNAIDKVPNLTIKSNGAMIPLLIYSGYHVVPNPDILRDAANIPPSVLISLHGLTYFNTLIEGRIKELTPVIGDATKTVISTQKASINYVKEFGTVKTQAWNDAARELRAGSGRLNSQIKTQVDQQLGQLRDEISSQMGGTPHQISQHVPQQIGPHGKRNGNGTQKP